MEAIYVVVGTILGFALNELSTRWREHRTEKRQARACRALLSLEIDQNLALLRDWWSEVTDIDSSLLYDPDDHYLLPASRLIELPLPSWSHKMWESQSQFLAIALNHEEIRQLSEIHGGIDTIEAIHSALTGAYAQQQEDLRSVRSKTGSAILPFGLTLRFHAAAPQLWTECARVVSELLTRGNPLAEPPTSSAAG